MPVTPTDLDTLEDVFVAALEAATPRYQRGRASRWKNFKRRRRVSTSLRVFRIEFDDDFDTPDGMIFPFVVDTTVPMAVVVDYGGVPDQVYRKMANSDSTQLREVMQSLACTTTGLIRVSRGETAWQPITDNAGDQEQVEFLFDVRYWKARV